MSKKKLLSTFKKSFFIGFSAFLFGTGASIIAPQSYANQGFFEYQWYPEEGYKKLRSYQSSSERLDRASYYFFLRGKERKTDIVKLALRVPDYFEAKIKPSKLSLCKVKIGGFKGRTACKEIIPSVIKINEKQTPFFNTINDLSAYLNKTCFLGILKKEFHYAVYPEGKFYKRHLRTYIYMSNQSE
mgnify:CR=1 FL=1